MLLYWLIPFYAIYNVIRSEKCYSCSSAHIHSRWPRDSEHRLMYLSEFPFYANETCDQMRDLLPIVPCPNSVCVKVIIMHPNRQTCDQGPIIVRDCWSRIMTAVDKKYALSPGDLEQLPLSNEDLTRIDGILHTCRGFLCNSVASSTTMIKMLFFMLIFAIL